MYLSQSLVCCFTAIRLPAATYHAACHVYVTPLHTKGCYSGVIYISSVLQPHNMPLYIGVMLPCTWIIFILMCICVTYSFPALLNNCTIQFFILAKLELDKYFSRNSVATLISSLLYSLLVEPRALPFFPPA